MLVALRVVRGNSGAMSFAFLALKTKYWRGDRSRNGLNASTGADFEKIFRGLVVKVGGGVCGETKGKKNLVYELALGLKGSELENDRLLHDA